MKNNNTWESIFNTIKNIVKVEFTAHQSNIKNLVNSNPNKINQFLVMISSEIGDLTASLEFTQKKLTSIGEGEKNKLDD